jgi:hypothetical protein
MVGQKHAAALGSSARGRQRVVVGRTRFRRAIQRISPGEAALAAQYLEALAIGPELDQGAALRLLAEMVWFPTALFDARRVTWTAIDAEHALATLRLGQLTVSATFEFGLDGLPTGMLAQRFMDKGGLRSWRGDYRDWRTVSGLRVPFEADVTWQLEAGPYTYAHWTVDSIEYDAPAEL